MSVSSWDGSQSLLEKERAVDKAHELKRRLSEMYDEDLDSGRVNSLFCYTRGRQKVWNLNILDYNFFHNIYVRWSLLCTMRPCCIVS